MEKMRWTDQQLHNDPAVEELARSLSGKSPFPLPLANILVQRGYDSFDKVKSFLKPGLDELHDAWDMKDMDRATVRILQAIDRNEKILIYGDYDVDGTTSVSLLTLFFRDWGVESEFYIPDRYKEGYGVSAQGIAYAVEEKIDLVLTLDCGTKAVDLIQKGKDQGVDFIVVDHHRPGEQLPPVEAMLNPLQEGCPYPCKVLSACGLVLKLIQALNDEFSSAYPERLPHAGYDPFERYCDLVTLSIASDIVPIVDENRIIALHGLEKIRSVPLPGIASLMALSPQERKWDISDLVFFIGPRINSAGRLRSARAAVQLLLGDPNEREAFAQALNHYNEDRKALDDTITEEAKAMIQEDPKGQDRFATVLYQADWHKGVIGIVASRLIERYFRPTILLTRSNGEWVGSARSVPGFDLYQTLLSCQQYLTRFGGHKYAAGLSLKEESLEAFREAFEEAVEERITPAQRIPELKVAHRLNFNEITPKFLSLLRRLAPFGPGNEEPIFLAEEVEVQDVRILKEKHVRFILRQNGEIMEAIGFSLAERWAEVNQIRMHLAYQLSYNTWRGKTTIQLRVKDFKSA